MGLGASGGVFAWPGSPRSPAASCVGWEGGETFAVTFIQHLYNSAKKSRRPANE